MKVCLYISAHNVTGLKYFGKTTQYFTENDLQKKYHGSGSHWRNHLKKHGDNVTMKIFGIFEINEVEQIALKFSEEHNITNSEKWANEKPENGLDGGSKKGLKRNKTTCHFCDKSVYPSEEMYHFDYCESNPYRKSRETECSFCGRSCSDNTGKGNHELRCKMNPDKIELKLNCKFCDKTYSDNGNLTVHENSCSKNPNREIFNCRFCGVSNKNKSTKIKHELRCEQNVKRINESYSCSFCNKEFGNHKSNKTSHELYFCDKNPDRRERKQFRCVCGKVYSDNGNYQKHLNKCKGN